MPGNALEGRLALVLDKMLDIGHVARTLEAVGLSVRRHRSGDYAVSAEWCDLELEWDHPPQLLLHGAVSDSGSNGSRIAEALRRAGLAFWGEAYDGSGREICRWPRS